MNEKISLIIPAFNEVHRIQETILEAIRYFEFRKLAYEIIVSVDGNDGTREVVADLQAANQAISILGQDERAWKRPCYSKSRKDCARFAHRFHRCRQQNTHLGIG